jgi:hypothetical protein
MSKSDVKAGTLGRSPAGGGFVQPALGGFDRPALGGFDRPALGRVVQAANGRGAGRPMGPGSHRSEERRRDTRPLTMATPSAANRLACSAS